MTTSTPPSTSSSAADTGQATTSAGFGGSLLDDADRLPPTPPPAAARRPRLVLPSWISRAWNRPAIRWSTLGVLALTLGIGLWLWMRPVPQPDYASDDMEDVLSYTLLTDEFNRLPVDERLKLLTELIARIRTMGSGDSVAMAAFAAAIDSDKLRKQVEANASRLALDVWDKFALDYNRVPTEQKSVYLDQVFLDMTKLMETVGGGSPSEMTDEERLADARKQAQRDQKALQSGQGPTGGQLARMTDFMRNRMGPNSSPQQQQRGMQLMRDMTRHLRDQDASTGKPD